MPHAMPGYSRGTNDFNEGVLNLGLGRYNLIRDDSYLCRAPNSESYYPPEHLG